MSSFTFETLLINEIPQSKITIESIYEKKLLYKSSDYDTLIKLLNLKYNLINNINNNKDLLSSIDLLIKVYSGSGNSMEKKILQNLRHLNR